MCFAIMVQTETEKVTLKVVDTIVEAVSLAKNVANTYVVPVISIRFIGIEEEI